MEVKERNPKTTWRSYDEKKLAEAFLELNYAKRQQEVGGQSNLFKQLNEETSSEEDYNGEETGVLQPVEDPRELLRKTLLQRQIQEQAKEVQRMNKNLFANSEGKADIARLKNKIATLQKKIQERTTQIAEEKKQSKLLLKFKKVYQDAAILRHKMLNRVHRKKSRRRKEAQQEYALEEADRMSQLVQHRQLLYEAVKQGTENNESTQMRNSIQVDGSTKPPADDLNMFQDLTELSVTREIREKRRMRRIQRRFTETKLKHYDTKINVISPPAELATKRPQTGLVRANRLMMTRTQDSAFGEGTGTDFKNVRDTPLGQLAFKKQGRDLKFRQFGTIQEFTKPFNTDLMEAQDPKRQNRPRIKSATNRNKTKLASGRLHQFASLGHTPQHQSAANYTVRSQKNYSLNRKMRFSQQSMPDGAGFDEPQLQVSFKMPDMSDQKQAEPSLPNFMIETGQTNLEKEQDSEPKIGIDSGKPMSNKHTVLYNSSKAIMDIIKDDAEEKDGNDF